MKRRVYALLFVFAFITQFVDGCSFDNYNVIDKGAPLCTFAYSKYGNCEFILFGKGIERAMIRLLIISLLVDIAILLVISIGIYRQESGR